MADDGCAVAVGHVLMIDHAWRWLVSDCRNCKCRPVADVVLCGFSDWCAVCDASLHAHHELEFECDRQRNLKPPHDDV